MAGIAAIAPVVYSYYQNSFAPTMNQDYSRLWVSVEPQDVQTRDHCIMPPGASRTAAPRPHEGRGALLYYTTRVVHQ